MARFSDPQLVQILQKASRRINRKLCLFGTQDEITVDGAGEVSTPAGDDGSLTDLVLLQAECMVASADFQSDLTSNGGGIMAKDGEQTIDTRTRAIARGTFFDSEYSPCAELKEAIMFEKLNRGSHYDIW